MFESFASRTVDAYGVTLVHAAPLSRRLRSSKRRCVCPPRCTRHGQLQLRPPGCRPEHPDPTGRRGSPLAMPNRRGDRDRGGMPMLGDHHPLLSLFDISHKFRETVPGVCQRPFNHSQKYRQIFGTRDEPSAHRKRPTPKARESGSGHATTSTAQKADVGRICAKSHVIFISLWLHAQWRAVLRHRH